MEILKGILFGDFNFWQYFGGQILAFLGYVLAFLLSYYLSDKPTKWSWKIFNKGKNWQMLIMLFILVWVLLRFNTDSINLVNKATNNKYAFIEDFWFWFLFLGFAIRFILHNGKDLLTKLGWIKKEIV